MAYAHSIFIWIIAYCSRLSFTDEVAQDNVIFTNQPCPDGHEGIFYSVDKSPTQYKHCGPAGFFWIFPCSPGTYFNQVEQACLLPPNATTTSTSTTTIPTVRTQIRTTTMVNRPLVTTISSTPVTDFVSAPVPYNSTIAVYPTPNGRPEDNFQLQSSEGATFPTESSSSSSTTTESTTSTAHATTKHQVPGARFTTTVPRYVVGDHNIAEEQWGRVEVQHQAPPLVPVFTAAEPKLFVTAGPYLENEEYDENYEESETGSVMLGEFQTTTPAPGLFGSSTPRAESHTTHELDYWEDNKAESPSIPLNPRIPQTKTEEQHVIHQFPEIHVISTDTRPSAVDKVEVVHPSNSQSNSNNPNVNVEVEGGKEVEQQRFIPLEHPIPVTPVNPSKTENIYEYHVVSPPTESPDLHETAQPTYEQVHEVYLQPAPPVGNANQQGPNHYSSNNNNGHAEEHEYSWPSYESEHYPQQPTEGKQVQVPESKGNHGTQNYYPQSNVYQGGHQPQYPQEYSNEETKYVKTVKPENLPHVNSYAKHTQELVLPPITERQSHVAASAKADNIVRTSGPKSFPKPVTLSPMAEELKKRISDEDLASMQRVFETLAAQAASRSGNAPMIPQLPFPPTGGDGGAPYVYPTDQSGREYPQIMPPMSPYFPQPAPPPPVTELPPNFSIESECKENGTCEFNAAVEMYCFHEIDPTFYYQCGPSAEDIGIWMLRQCPAGLQLNDEGQCGKRKNGVKNPPTKTQTTSTLTTNAPTEPIDRNYEIPSPNVQSNLYPTYNSNVKGNQPVVTDNNFAPKQPVYPNYEVPQTFGQNIIYPKVPQTNTQGYVDKQSNNYVNAEYAGFQNVILPKTAAPPVQQIDQPKSNLVNNPYPTKPPPQTYESQYQPQPPQSQLQTVDNQYPQYPPIYQANGYQQGYQQTYSVANDKQVPSTNNNYVQYPKSGIANPNQVDNFNYPQWPTAAPSWIPDQQATRQPSVAKWVIDQQPTKQPLIPPNNPYRPAPNSVTTVRGGTLPASVVAKLANLANLDNLAKAIAAKNVYGQGQEQPSQNNFIQKPGHIVPIASNQQTFPQYGTNYLGQPVSYGSPNNLAPMYNPYLPPDYKGFTNVGGNGNVQQAIAYALNNQVPIKPKNPYANIRPQIASRDAAPPLTWSTNESTEKTSEEPMYVWRPIPGQRCSLLASPRAQVFANQEDYKSFFMCVSRHKDRLVDPADGIWTLLQCPEDTVFNPSLKVCDKSYLDLKQRRLTN